MDILRLFRDFSVPHATDGHKHTRPGWVNTECPFCIGNVGLHLGWNIRDEYFMCWRCGWHPPLLTLHKLMGLSQIELQKLVVNYGINRSLVSIKSKDKKEFAFPTNVTDFLYESHKKYLSKRDFDPIMLQEIWGIKSLSPDSKLDGISYAHRILIPYNWNGQTVSFDSRDVTGKQSNKYQACPKEREEVEHKRILYGNQEAWGSTGIGVEGCTDVWRLGERACAVSGIKFTHAQVRVIANTFKKFAVVFDDESQAQAQAGKLVAELKARGVHAWKEKIKGDPGGLTNKEAKQLVKTILNK